MKDNNYNVFLSSLSFLSSILSIFVMYYILAGVALVLGLFTIKDEKSRKLSITSISIVCITFIFKVIYNVVTSGNLPEWLTNGLF